MNIALIGASGMIGSRVLNELVRRGHRVTAIARDPAKIPAGEGVNPVRGDANDAAGIAGIVAGHDAVVSATAPDPAHPESVLQTWQALRAGLVEAGVRRVIVVGGAGSLEVAPGQLLVDTPEFPAAWKGIASAHNDLLRTIRAEGGDLDWAYFSPAAFIEPGERTGRFRLGDDALVADAEGNSRISAEDYAVALVDELERPQHVQARFTVGY